MRDLEIHRIVKLIIRRLPFVIIPALLLSAAVGYVKMQSPPSYKATAEVVITSQETSDNFTSIQGSLKLMDTYNVILKNPLILEQVIAALGLPYSTDQLAAKVSAKSVELSQVIRITVTDGDRKQAASIANTVVSVFRSQSLELFKINNIVLLHKASAEKAVYVSANPLFYMLLSFVGGLIVLLCLWLLLHMMSRKLQTAAEVQAIFADVPMETTKLASRLETAIPFYGGWMKRRMAEEAKSRALRYRHVMEKSGQRTLAFGSLGRKFASGNISKQLAMKLSGESKVAWVRFNPNGKLPSTASGKKGYAEWPISQGFYGKIKTAGKQLDFIEVCVVGGSLSMKTSAEELMAQLRESYEVVIWDLPSYVHCSEAQTIAELADWHTLVIKENRILSPVAQEWKSRLAATDVQINSIVFIEV